MPLSMEELNRLSLERSQVAPNSFAAKPLQPDNITVTAGKRAFRIQWSQVPGVEGYRVAALDDQDLSEPDLIKTIVGNSNLEWTYNVGNVALTRYFAVQSFNADESSDFTELQSATTTIDVPNLLNSDFTDNSHTGDTNQTTLVTYTMPASTMGISDVLEIRAWGTMSTNANSKTIRVKFGGTQISGLASTSKSNWHVVSYVANRDSASSQTSTSEMTQNFTTTNATVIDNATPSINTASSVDIIITGQLANGSDTVTVNGWLIKRYSGDAAESAPPTPPSQPIEPSTSSTPFAEKPGRDFGTL